MTFLRYTVARADLHDIRAQTEAISPLLPGQARLRVDRFALTANNITYAAFGDSMRYWDFYPCDDPQRGCIPVWGYADVTESRVDGVAPGERFYGFWPMAQHVTVNPVRVGPGGFIDGAPHRRELAGIYNQAVRCTADPLYRPELEAQSALLRPLFTTAFLIDDFLAEAGWFGASAVWLSSASSKTAAATAFCLARRRGSTTAVKVCGLTSGANAAHCRSLGVYDEVARYEDMATLDTGGRAVYVDFSGSTALRRAIHTHLGDRLAYSCAVGGTHWDELGGDQGLPGPRPVLFFAPAQAKRRVAEWGEAGFGQRLAEAWQAFLVPVTDPVAPWVRVVTGAGAEAVTATYREVLGGSRPAAEGQVLTP